MQTQQGLDYKLYQIYLWGGLPALVIYILVATLVFGAYDLPGPQPFLVIGVPLFLWIGGIFLYWWWVFIFKGNKELEELIQTQEPGLPKISALKNWNTLHPAMAISGGSTEELIKKAKKTRRPILIWFAFSNLLALWICCSVSLGSLGLIDGFGLGTWLAGVIIWVILMIGVTYFLIGWGGKTAEEAYLAPLGLAITQTPVVMPEVIGILMGGYSLVSYSPAIVEGKRHGRLVHIETIDKHCMTVVQAQLPEFQVTSEAGKLTPKKGAPEEVSATLKSLRKAKRWQGIHVYAGPQGLGIQRESKGTNMWLYDLWLAEYLIDNINTGQHQEVNNV